MNLHSNMVGKRQEQTDTSIIQAPVQIANGEETGFQRNRTQGYISQCDGKMAIIAATDKADDADSDGYWTVGQLISVVAGKSRVVGLICKVEASGNVWHVDDENQINIHIELIGEITDGNDNKSRFKSGISTYPYLGAVAHKIRATDLAAIYENNDNNTVRIGSITQDSTIPALVSVDSLLSRHFAIVGTTGVGKSTSVALIIRKIIETRPDIRTLILDPHNEFAAAFPGISITVDATTLELPFWMFTLEEFTEVIYRGRIGIGAEIDALRDLIPEAKLLYETGPDSGKSPSLAKKARGAPSYTADTPVPYRMKDLIKLMDDRIGLLEGKAERPHLKSLKNRLASVMADPRFKFMFDSKSGANAMSNFLSKVFRIPQNGKPICVFELSGLPSEVVNVVASVMCRLAFDLGSSSDGAIKTLVICEEAHRYIPADPNVGFLPTRLAIAKIAKEGRKYGVYLGVVTQRPGELDTTILSQCNTIFAMRLGSDHDQKIVRKAITGAANSTVSFLSSLANRECIAFGEAIDAPMRMTFENVTKEKLPGSNIYENAEAEQKSPAPQSLSSVIIKLCELGTGGSSQSVEEHEFMNKIKTEDRLLSGSESEQRATNRSQPAAFDLKKSGNLHDSGNQTADTPFRSLDEGQNPSRLQPTRPGINPVNSQLAQRPSVVNAPPRANQNNAVKSEQAAESSNLIRAFRSR